MFGRKKKKARDTESDHRGQWEGGLMRPYLLIDIDGVLNPFGLDFDPEGFIQHEISIGSHGVFEVFLSEDNRERIQGLSEHFELIWGTMWEHDANDHIDLLLGISDPLPVIEFSSPIEYAGVTTSHRLSGRRVTPYNATYKLPYVRKWADDGDKALAWIDDDLGYDVFKWAEEREHPTLPIRVEASVGLTDTDVGDLIDFAKVVADGSPV